MSRLLKARDWLTIDEAAKYLTAIVGERVFPQHICRFVLDRKLPVAVHLKAPHYARVGRIAPTTETPTGVGGLPQTAAEQPARLPKGIRLGDVTFHATSFQPELVEAGLWDLPLVGDERFNVENEYQALVGGTQVQLHSSLGTFVTRGESWCQLFRKTSRDEMAHAPMVACSGLPDGCSLAIRPSDLDAFAIAVGGPLSESSEKKKTLDKPLRTREREVLLTLIAVLSRRSNVPLENPTTASKLVERWVADAGASVAARTIENHLRTASTLIAKPREK